MLQAEGAALERGRAACFPALTPRNPASPELAGAATDPSKRGGLPKCWNATDHPLTSHPAPKEPSHTHPFPRTPGSRVWPARPGRRGFSSVKLLTKGELVRRPGHANSAACSSQLATPAAGKPRSSLPRGAIPAGCSAAQRGAGLRGRDGVCKTPRRRLLGEDRSSPGWARALTLSTPQPSALPLPASLRPCPATTALTSPGQRAAGHTGAVWVRAFEASAKVSWKPAAGVGAPTRFAGRHAPHLLR